MRFIYIPEPGGKSPLWIEIFASEPLVHSLSTCTTSLWDMPLTDLPLISIKTSPSCNVLHLGRSKIFLTFCPKAESAIVKPKPIPPAKLKIGKRSYLDTYSLKTK